MALIASALAFVLALLVSVDAARGGSLRVRAKLFGMKATQFFVGFGPTLWSRRKGETEYGVKAIPAGGFVKIVGMTPLEEVEPRTRGPGVLPAARPASARWCWSAGSTMHFVLGDRPAVRVTSLACPARRRRR